MKLYVIRARRMAVYLVALSAALLALFAVNMGKNNDALAVFSSRKEIPIYSVDVPEKVASTTFDCAWGAGDIPDILNTLKEADVKATFFLVGQWAEKHPDTVRLIAQEGHDIANHSYSHFRMGSLDRGKASSEISQCSELLERLTGTKCDFSGRRTGTTTTQSWPKRASRGILRSSGMLIRSIGSRE